MPDLRFQPSPATLTEIPRPKRGEGQWALGYTEPLNKNEQSKKDDDPLHVRDRILHIYSKRGFASIDPADLRGRFRWMGLYTQRAPGLRRRQDRDARGGGARRRVLHAAGPLRRRAALAARPCARWAPSASTSPATPPTSPTGRTSSTTGSGSRTSPRSGSGSTTPGCPRLEACGDSPRPFLGSPVAGVAADEIIDGTSALEEITRRYIGNPTFSNLPRKFKTALTGHPSHDVSPETNDVAFVGTVHPEHGPGFDLWVGGGLSTNPMLAQKVGVWIPLDEVADVWEGVASIFRDYGYRRLRSRARLKFLVADWGVEKFREVLENEYLGRPLVSCDSPASPVGHRDHIGVHAQKDGRLLRRDRPDRRAGSPARMLVALADLMERVRRRRRPAHAVPEDRADRRRPGGRRRRSLDRLDAIGLSGAAVELAAEHDGLHRHRVLQAGDRRHQEPGPRPGRRARAALPRPRRADHRQRQRLPERLRPHPGRRHRPQGPAA